MKEGFGTYMKRAFSWHWHLLALGAGVVAGIFSGHPEVVLPLVAAGELLYLGMLGTNDRFQKVLRGQELLEANEDKAAAEAKRLEKLMEFLSEKDRTRFYSLRERCQMMTRLRAKMESGGEAVGGAAATSSSDADFRNRSLDRLLWLFLKLLHHEEALERFIGNTSGEILAQSLEDTREQVAAAEAADGRERLADSLREKMDTIEQRLANYREAEENLELIRAELDKTEQKIAHICEVGMTSRDGTEFSHQIKGIADGVSLSEKALADLDVGNIFDEQTGPTFIEGEYAASMNLVEVEN